MGLEKFPLSEVDFVSAKKDNFRILVAILHVQIWDASPETGKQIELIRIQMVA